VAGPVSVGLVSGEYSSSARRFPFWGFARMYPTLARGARIACGDFLLQRLVRPAGESGRLIYSATFLVLINASATQPLVEMCCA
jgi:hypothetical protein